MQDEAIYRCINEACARGMPRPVAFCPYCGTAQTAAARAQAPLRADGEGARQAAALASGAAAASAPSGWSDAPAQSSTSASSASSADDKASANAGTSWSSAFAAASAASSAASSSAAPAATGAAAPSATAFGHSGRLGAAPASTAAPSTAAPAAAPPERARGIPWTRTPKAPPPPGPGGRTPVRLRWWLLVLALLWAVWMVAKPSARKVERRIDAAIVLARDCKPKGAQDELIALRAAHATPAQLERLQRAMNEASTSCTRKRQREKAWNEASGAAEIALAGNNADKAHARLQAFTRRWGEDDDTRALQARIEAGRHPLAAPETNTESTDDAKAAPQSMAIAAPHAAQSARNLIAEARADLARGDAGAARDKMDLCLAMVDPSDRACAALKADIERADGGR